MCKSFDIIYDEKTGTWGEKKEPFAIIEIASEKDYRFFHERLKKQVAKKPLGVDLHGIVNGNIHKWVCPICKNFLAGRGAIDNETRFLPNYCCICGQKIDRSDVK